MDAVHAFASDSGRKINNMLSIIVLLLKRILTEMLSNAQYERAYTVTPTEKNSITTIISIADENHVVDRTMKQVTLHGTLTKTESAD